MKNKEDWLIALAAFFLFDVLLVFAEKLGMQADVTWFVYAVHISETSSDGEVGADWLRVL